MNSSRISAIAAFSENKVIGDKGKIPWNIPADFKRVKDLTTGTTLIMGRKTHESIGRLLPGRTSIIVSRDKDYKVEGGIVVNSIDEAIKTAKTLGKEIFIFGGGEIFRQAMPFTDRLYLTIVHITIDGDAYFPDYSEFTKEIERVDGEDNGFSYTFLTLEREG